LLGGGTFIIAAFFFLWREGLPWIDRGRDHFFQGEAEGRGIKGALSGPLVAVNGKSDIVCGVLIFMLGRVRWGFVGSGMV
jgi:hypothetical protein